MEIDKEINKINSTLGQGFAIKIGDYIVKKEKNPRLVKPIEHSFICIDLKFGESKGNDGKKRYTPIAVVRRCNEKDEGFEVCEVIGNSVSEPSFDVLQSLTFLVNVSNLVKEVM